MEFKFSDMSPIELLEAYSHFNKIPVRTNKEQGCLAELKRANFVENGIKMIEKEPT